jgi:acyl-[acyl-carrier protein] desaturase
MSEYYSSNVPEVEKGIYTLYRDFFEKAEKKRRWSLREDIPWDQCDKNANPAIADVVESFCAVELYLPDYVGKYLPHNRAFRGRAWFTMNWGYEESKHSLALGDWLLHSKHRSDEQMDDLDKEVFKHEWNLPMDNDRAMVAYSMTQERATWLHYRNLAQIVGEKGDPALYRLLRLIAIDECAHYNFFVSAVKLHLQVDRAHMVEQLRRVINSFAMPAVHMLSDGRRRMEAVKSLHIFDDEIFFNDVFTPILQDLGVTRQEMRRRTKREFTLVGEAVDPRAQDLSQLRKSA